MGFILATMKLLQLIDDKLFDKNALQFVREFILFSTVKVDQKHSVYQTELSSYYARDFAPFTNA